MRTPGEIDELLAPLFPGLMGMRVTAVGAERVVGTLEVRADLGTAGGTLHGGADGVRPRLVAVVTQTQLVLDA